MASLKRNRFPEDTIQDLRELGFRVYMRDRADSWVVIESDDGICYADYESFRGFNISTIHKPSREKGTGYQWRREVSGITKEAVMSAIRAHAPAWEHSSSPIRKYKDIEEYKKANSWNAVYTEVTE